MISEIENDDSPPTRQFLRERFTTPYTFDQNGLDGRILVYIREDIPSELISTNFSNRDGFFLALNLKTKKWVLYCSYNPHNNFIETNMDSIGKVIDSLSARYENFILIGDFNVEESDTITKDFCDIYSFIDLIKDSTYFKCIDLMLTNRNRSFKKSCVIDTRLSELHKMTATILRSHLNKLGPRIIYYRNCKKHSNDAFTSELVTKNGNLQNCNELDSFLSKCKDVLNRTVPIKQKHVRTNKRPFINENILKTITKRTRLKNKSIKY